jgi:hypothetical protein
VDELFCLSETVARGCFDVGCNDGGEGAGRFLCEDEDLFDGRSILYIIMRDIRMSGSCKSQISAAVDKAGLGDGVEGGEEGVAVSRSG